MLLQGVVGKTHAPGDGGWMSPLGSFDNFLFLLNVYFSGGVERNRWAQKDLNSFS